MHSSILTPMPVQCKTVFNGEPHAATQEESTRRREALRLETESQLRKRRMDLEQEMEAQKRQVLWRIILIDGSKCDGQRE